MNTMISCHLVTAPLTAPHTDTSPGLRLVLAWPTDDISWHSLQSFRPGYNNSLITFLLFVHIFQLFIFWFVDTLVCNVHNPARLQTIEYLSRILLLWHIVELFISESVSVLLSQTHLGSDHLGRICQVSSVIRGGVELQQLGRGSQSPGYGSSSLEELDGVAESNDTVEIIISAGDLATSSLNSSYSPVINNINYVLLNNNCLNSLFRSPLNLNVNLGTEGVHVLAGEVESEMVEARLELEDLGSAQSGHVNRLISC